MQPQNVRNLWSRRCPFDGSSPAALREGAGASRRRVKAFEALGDKSGCASSLRDPEAQPGGYLSVG